MRHILRLLNSSINSFRSYSLGSPRLSPLIPSVLRVCSKILWPWSQKCIYPPLKGLKRAHCRIYWTLYTSEWDINGYIFTYSHTTPWHEDASVIPLVEEFSYQLLHNLRELYVCSSTYIQQFMYSLLICESTKCMWIYLPRPCSVKLIFVKYYSLKNSWT